MKTIWFILRSSIHKRRPVMSVIQSLLNDKNIKIKLISIESLNLETDLVTEYILPVGIGRGKFEKIKTYFKFRSYVNQVLKKELKKDDYIWLGSLDTINACLGLSIIRKSKYICHIHELYDTNPFRLKIAKNFIKDSYKVVVPEINRAGILQVWLGLKERPIVLPNKPYDHPRTRKIEPTNDLTRQIISTYYTDKPIILYQGHIGGDRNLMPLAQAMKQLPEYEFWLLGTDHGYADQLVAVAENIKYLGSVPAPHHLEITSYASIGIMSYDPINLNNLYCAPNKVWEYSGFGIPFLANDCLSLLNLENIQVGKISSWEVSDIIATIRNIMCEYTMYQKKSRIFYDSYVLEESIREITS